MPGKRKGRPKTVGDCSTSPEDKKSRQTFEEEYSNNEALGKTLGRNSVDEAFERLFKVPL